MTTWTLPSLSPGALTQVQFAETPYNGGEKVWLTRKAVAGLEAVDSPLSLTYEGDWLAGLPTAAELVTSEGSLFLCDRFAWKNLGGLVAIKAIAADGQQAIACFRPQQGLIPPAELALFRRSVSFFTQALTRRSQFQLVALIAAIWQLMESLRAVQHRELLPATRSRGGRSGARPTLTTIDVRPVEPDSTPTVIGHSGFRREHDHRWSVRGHFRNQPYGPGRHLRRRVWIANHVAGPPDKPLRERTGPTVHVVRGG